MFLQGESVGKCEELSSFVFQIELSKACWWLV